MRSPGFNALAALAIGLAGCAQERRPTAQAEDIVAAVDHAQSLTDGPVEQPQPRRDDAHQN
jgi:hypothetical protein